MMQVKRANRSIYKTSLYTLDRNIKESPMCNRPVIYQSSLSYLPVISQLSLSYLSVIPQLSPSYLSVISQMSLCCQQSG